MRHKVVPFVKLFSSKLEIRNFGLCVSKVVSLLKRLCTFCIETCYRGSCRTDDVSKLPKCTGKGAHRRVSYLSYNFCWGWLEISKPICCCWCRPSSSREDIGPHGTLDTQSADGLLDQGTTCQGRMFELSYVLGKRNAFESQTSSGSGRRWRGPACLGACSSG